jgi:nudix-type nucleoside diphosphatase (YffH/AdpP family)
MSEHQKLSSPDTVSHRVKVQSIETLSKNWYVLKKATFQFQRETGEWQEQQREVYDRGNGVAILLYDTSRRNVILTRQFRFPAFANGYRDLLVEVPAGLLDNLDPASRVRNELEEETGYRVGEITKVFEVFMSPGSVTEILHLYIAAYDPSNRVGAGGGLKEEGEEIGVFEIGFDQAMAMVKSGQICDAKTIMLLQHVALEIFTKR